MKGLVSVTAIFTFVFTFHIAALAERLGETIAIGKDQDGKYHAYVLKGDKIERADGQYKLNNLTILNIQGSEVSVDVNGKRKTFEVKNAKDLKIGEKVQLEITAEKGKIKDVAVTKADVSVKKKK